MGVGTRQQSISPENKKNKVVSRYCALLNLRGEFSELASIGGVSGAFEKPKPDIGQIFGATSARPRGAVQAKDSGLKMTNKTLSPRIKDVRRPSLL